MLQMVRNEYDELFEGDVASVHVVYNTSALDSHVQEYDKGVRDLEDLIDDYASQKARDKSIKRRQVQEEHATIHSCPLKTVTISADDSLTSIIAIWRARFNK